MSVALFLSLYFGLLTLPGLAFLKLIHSTTNPFLASIGISYSLFSLVFVSANHYSVGAEFFIYVLVVVLALSIIYLAWSIMSQRQFGHSAPGWDLTPLIVIAGISAVYQVIFGSYTEVPADMFAHMERYQSANANLGADKLGNALSWKALLLQESGVFYYLLAMVGFLTDVSADTLVKAGDYANRTLFLSSVFFFSREIFKQHAQKTLVAALATLLVALHMGINVFSYVRYYTLAPTMLNMIVYMVAISIFLRVASASFDRKSSLSYIAITILTVTAATVHVQEALYILVMVSIISLVIVVNRTPGLVTARIGTNSKQAYIITIVAAMAFCIAYIYSNQYLGRAPNAHWRLWEFSEGSGLFPAISTLNLKFQFSRVVTLWGMLVYILFFLNFRRYRDNLFIVAGMLSPVITILNPFFVDLFLRHENSTTLWRLSYLIPIHFVAADLIVHYAAQIKQELVIRKTIAAFVLIPLVVLLLPFNNTWRGIHYNRFPTLAAVDPQLSYEYSSDLLGFLRSMEKSHTILTDPMTGYMVSAMTRHKHYRKKFMRDYQFERFTFEDYRNNPLEKYRGHLLIINRRAQKSSRIGALSKHWSHREWKNISYYYPDQLMDHLESNNQQFEKLWNEHDIWVYRIN